MNRLQSILVGVDPTGSALAALQQAARRSKGKRATLHLLRVIDSTRV